MLILLALLEPLPSFLDLPLDLHLKMLIIELLLLLEAGVLLQLVPVAAWDLLPS
jgi:hypothetical protein